MSTASLFDKTLREEIEYFQSKTSAIKNCPKVEVEYRIDPSSDDGIYHNDEQITFTLIWQFNSGVTIKADYDIGGESSTYVFILEPVERKSSLVVFNDAIPLHLIVRSWLHHYSSLILSE